MSNETKKPEVQFKNVTVQYSDDPDSKAIVLPEGMSFKKGVEWLLRQGEEQSKEVALHYEFGGFYPLDAAFALYKALQKLYGFTSLVSTPGFFGPTPPALVGVEYEPGKTVQIPWGSFEISGIKGKLTTSLTLKDGMVVLALGGKCIQRDRAEVDKVVALMRDILARESIYKGKAIRVDLTLNPSEPLKAPKFMDLTGVKETDLIFPYVVQEMVETNIFSLIKHTATCRTHDIPRRRGVLLAGPYGTGKTLTARVTAKVCEDNGWTFIYLDDLKQLPQALYLAKNYAPSVVFGEDINRVVDGERDEKMDEYFNVLDGIDRKKDEVMCVFTTNNVDDIHPGMMRPGRIDAIIPVEPPDAEATQRLVKVYGRGLLAQDIDLRVVGSILAGQIPAVCREAVERAKLCAIRDTHGAGRLVVTADHLESAARQMVKHAEYINREGLAPKPDLAILGEAIGEKIADAMNLKRYNDWLNREGEFENDSGDDSPDDRTPKEVAKAVLAEGLNQAGRPKNGNGKKNGNGHAKATT